MTTNEVTVKRITEEELTLDVLAIIKYRAEFEYIEVLDSNLEGTILKVALNPELEIDLNDCDWDNASQTKVKYIKKGEIHE